jgi:hypothetical protein
VPDYGTLLKARLIKTQEIEIASLKHYSVPKPSTTQSVPNLGTIEMSVFNTSLKEFGKIEAIFAHTKTIRQKELVLFELMARIRSKGNIEDIKKSMEQRYTREYETKREHSRMLYENYLIDLHEVEDKRLKQYVNYLNNLQEGKDKRHKLTKKEILRAIGHSVSRHYNFVILKYGEIEARALEISYLAIRKIGHVTIRLSRRLLSPLLCILGVKLWSKPLNRTIRWLRRRPNDTKKITHLHFKKNGEIQAAENLIPKQELRKFNEHKREDKPRIAMERFLMEHNYPAEGYEDLCLRMTLGRVVPGAIGVRDCDEELINSLTKAGNGSYAGFMNLATRIALKALHKEGAKIWEVYKTTDHYAKHYRRWWGGLRRRRRRHMAAIDPHDVKVKPETRQVLFTMLYIATAIAPDCISRLKQEQAREKIALVIKQNLQGQVTAAGASVAAEWAADIVCAMQHRQGF